MNKSLRNRLLVRTFFALVLVVGSNRLVSHMLSRAYVMEAVETGMALILARCDNEGRQGQSAFRSCARTATDQTFFEHLALDLTACPLHGQKAQAAQAAARGGWLRRGAADLRAVAGAARRRGLASRQHRRCNRTAACRGGA